MFERRPLGSGNGTYWWCRLLHGQMTGCAYPVFVRYMRERTFVTGMIGLGLVMPIGLALLALWTVVH